MKKLLLPLAALLLSLSASAQTESSTSSQSWHFGVAAGYHGSKLKYSNLDETLYPKNDFLGSGVFSLFLRKEFGSQGNFVIRPEVDVLNRGGKLPDIQTYKNSSATNQVTDLTYQLKAHYVDVRVPLMWQFGNSSSNVRPYLMVAPIVGMCTGGDIRLDRTYASTDMSVPCNTEGVRFDITKANMKSLYVAGAAGAGFNWFFTVNNAHRFFLGLEASYEYGFTDTYGDENDADIKVAVNPNGSTVEGTRRMHGFEAKVSLGVPFSVFCKQRPTRRVEPLDNFTGPVFDEPKPEVKEDEKPCYSLEEINLMLLRGENIEGKTICAIDDVINFEFGKSVITPESYDYLDQLAQLIRRTNAHVRVTGHTDNVGEEDYNMRLSRDRAMAVYNYLIEHGVPASRLSYAFLGMSHPITTNDTEEGRRMNRRVEFEILK